MRFPDKLDLLTVQREIDCRNGWDGRHQGRRFGGVRARRGRESSSLCSSRRSELCWAYAYHLVQAHAFIDGNKRIAAAITETFLETNGVQLIMTNVEITELFLRIASSAIGRDQAEQSLRAKVRIAESQA
jgi:death on curing protein